ncbi:MAG: hypothetical protein K2K56_14995 [Lachnospiraceae bacterium]|nr:hypothetical protein [Lachnospiraceae bacterium]
MQFAFLGKSRFGRHDRLGEVAGLTWQDINLEEQYLTVRRSVRYNGATHKHEIGSTKIGIFLTRKKE